MADVPALEADVPRYDAEASAFEVKVWADGYAYSVHRSAAEFSALHGTLRKRFPQTAVPDNPLLDADAAPSSVAAKAAAAAAKTARRLSRASAPAAGGDASDLASRRGALTAYLLALIDLPEVVGSETFTAFLQQHEAADGDGGGRGGGGGGASAASDGKAKLSKVLEAERTRAPESAVDFLLAAAAPQSQTVRPGYAFERDFAVKAGETVAWSFGTLQKDIAFSVALEPDGPSPGAEARKYERHPAHERLVQGSLVVEASGKCTLKWGNEYSKWYKKVLHYRVAVLTREGRAEAYEKRAARDNAREAHGAAALALQRAASRASTSTLEARGAPAGAAAEEGPAAAAQSHGELVARAAELEKQNAALKAAHGDLESDLTAARDERAAWQLKCADALRELSEARAAAAELQASAQDMDGLLSMATQEAATIGDALRTRDLQVARLRAERKVLKAAVLEYRREAVEAAEAKRREDCFKIFTAGAAAPNGAAPDDSAAADAPEGAAQNAAAAAEAEAVADWPLRLGRFYDRYNAEKRGEVETVLRKFSGREPTLFAMLYRKYETPEAEQTYHLAPQPLAPLAALDAAAYVTLARWTAGLKGGATLVDLAPAPACLPVREAELVGLSCIVDVDDVGVFAAWQEDLAEARPDLAVEVRPLEHPGLFVVHVDAK